MFVEVGLPDGRVAELEVPEDATERQILSFTKKQFDSGRFGASPEAQKLNDGGFTSGLRDALAGESERLAGLDAGPNVPTPENIEARIALEQARRTDDGDNIPNVLESFASNMAGGAIDIFVRGAQEAAANVADNLAANTSERDISLQRDLQTANSLARSARERGERSIFFDRAAKRLSEDRQAEIDTAIADSPLFGVGDSLREASDKAKGFKEQIEEFYDTPEEFQQSLAGDVSAAAGRLGPTILASMSSGPGAFLMFADAGTRAVEDYEQEQISRGLDPNEISLAEKQKIFAAYGVAEAALEKVGINKILEPIFKGGGKKSIGEILKGVAGASATEGGTELLQSITQDEIIEAISGQEREQLTQENAREKLREAVVGMIIGGGVRGATETVASVAQVIEKREAVASENSSESNFSRNLRRGLEQLESESDPIGQIAQANNIPLDAAERVLASNDPDQALEREVLKEQVKTPEGAATWAANNREAAEVIQSKEKPTRKDFEDAGLPRMSAKERRNVASFLADVDLDAEVQAELEQEVVEEAEPVSEKPPRPTARSLRIRQSEFFTPTRIEDQPITFAVINDIGGIESKSAAQKAGKDTLGEYDGAPILSPTTSGKVYGGQQSPDQAAQALFDQGLLSEPTADALWNAIDAESAKTVQANKQGIAFAKEQIRQAVQREDFNNEAFFQDFGDVSASASTIAQAESVKIDGEKFDVIDVELDKNGEIERVVIQDGPRFGRQTIEGDEVVFVEEVQGENDAEIQARDSDPEGTVETEQELLLLTKPALIEKAKGLGIKGVSSKRKDVIAKRVIEEQQKKASQQIGGDLEAGGMAALNSPSDFRAARKVGVDPIEGKGTKPTREILFDVAKSIGLNVVYKGQSKRALGTYYPGTSKTSVRYEGDLLTTGHEIAHALDDRFGIVGRWAGNGQRSPFDAELAPFAEVTTPSKASLKQRRAEGVAEWMLAWLVNPDEAAKAAPKFAAHFEKTVPLKTRNDLRAFGDDIRQFAGATAAEKVLANVRLRADGVTGRLRSLVTGSKGSGFEVSFWDKVQKQVTDSLRPFEAAMEFARTYSGELLPSRDPMVLARLFAGVNGKAETVFENGMIDTEGNRVTGGGVTWLLEKFDTSSKEALDADTNDAIALMIAQRTLEKEELRQKQIEAQEEAREKGEPIPEVTLSEQLTGIGGGIYNDPEVAEQAMAEFRQDPERLARLEEGAKRYREWAQANLQYLVDSGRLSQKAFDKILEENTEYVALSRLREVKPGVEAHEANYGKGGTRLGSANNPLNRFKGSSKVIENPYQTLLFATHQAIREGDRNNVMRSVADVLESDRSMYSGETNELASVGRKTNAQAEQKISIWRDGKQEYWQFDNDVHDSLKGLSESVVLPRAATFLPKMLRWGVTRMPAFATRNLIRDVQSRLTVTRSGTKRGLKETFNLRGNMDPEQLKVYGGDQFGYYAKDKVDYMRAMDTAVSQLVDDPKTILIHPNRIGAGIKRLAQGYDSLLQKGEQFNRLAEYNAAYDKAKEELGYSDYDASLYAAAQARDLIDFAVAGVTIKWMNQLFPFTNPTVQGLRRTIRAAKENPAAFGVKWSLYAAIPSLLTRLIAEALDYEEEYEQLPAYQRDLFWNFKLADDLWMRIPKNFEMGVLGAFPDRLYSKVKGDKNAFDGYGGSVVRSMTPVDENALTGPFKGVIGAMANHDFFRKDTIVSPWEKGKDLDKRNSEHASRLGKAFQGIAELSGAGDTKLGRTFGDARVVDYLFREQLGIFGDTLVRASNVGRDDTNRKLSLFREAGIFSTTPAWGSRDVQAAFNLAERRGVSTKDPVFSDLNDALDRYFEAESGKQRQSVAEEIMRHGKKVREILENKLEDGAI